MRRTTSRLVSLAMVAAGLAAGTVAVSAAPAAALDEQFVFSDTGCSTWTVPAGLNADVRIVAVGSAGEAATRGVPGGSGDRVEGTLPALAAGTALGICVNVGGGAGGFSPDPSYMGSGGAGGGASAVSLGSFSSPLVVAGGGGGAGGALVGCFYCLGGQGGAAGSPAGSPGQDQAPYEDSRATGGGGGSQDAPGAAGTTTFNPQGAFGPAASGSASTPERPGAGGAGGGITFCCLNTAAGGGGGGGYHGGGGGIATLVVGSGGGGGSDHCASSLTSCTAAPEPGSAFGAGPGQGLARVELTFQVADTDGDRVPDYRDNCPTVANDQSDGDGDGLGDVCEPTVTALSGSPQSATPGQAFASPLVASVVSPQGNVIPGVPVTFVIAPGSATNGSASFAGGATTATVASGADGQATSPALVAGSTTGPVSVRATVPGDAGSATWALTVAAAGPVRADLAVSVGAPASVARGGTVNVTVKVANNGASTASKVGTVLTVPAGWSVTSAGGGTVVGRSLVTFATPSLGARGQVTYTVRLTAPRTRTTSYLLGATLSATQDPVLSNNLAIGAVKVT